MAECMKGQGVLWSFFSCNWGISETRILSCKRLRDYSTYRKHPEERRLARVLQADHGDIHLCSPTVCQSNSPTPAADVDFSRRLPHMENNSAGKQSCHSETCGTRHRLTYQKVRNSQSYTFFTSCAIVYYVSIPVEKVERTAGSVVGRE